jgi:aryl-alcohol dehydrogenase-like predicted oxidoreductase
METLRLGGELTVARMGFGAMRLCGPGIWGPPADRAGALAVLRATRELGINFIDTADAYGPNVDEEQIAEALHPYAADLVIATKGGLTRPAAERWDHDARPAHLIAACEGSLRRLRRDRIDVYQLHAPDPQVPFAESVGALARLREQGKIVHVGLSNVSVEEIEEARRLVPIVSVQNRYNLGDRASDAVVDYCTREKLAFLPWYPLGGWSIAGDAKALERVAHAHGATTAQVALAWLLARSPMMLPIPGTARLDHLRENVSSTRIQLSAQELSALAS